ncbi:MAG: peptidoglycan recognition family protein [Phycisphaerales bacterium]
MPNRSANTNQKVEPCMGVGDASVPSFQAGGNGSEKSFVRGMNADHALVRTDCSRRTVLQLGSLAGLAALAGGCAGGGSGTQANGEPLPGPDWPPLIPKPTPSAPPPSKDGPKLAGPTQPQPQPPVPNNPPTPPAGLPTGVLPRTRWTTAGVARPSNVRPLGGVSYITVHHDGMPFAFTSTDDSDSIKRLRSIKDAHLDRKSKTGEKWADIGYHYIIDRAGRVWEGRPIAYQGAHVQDYNEHNIGVMCMGNFMLQSPSKAQTDRLDQFVAQLMRDYRVPLRNVRTHQEWNPTECPGRALQTYMMRTRSRGGGMALALQDTDAMLLA